MFSYEQLILVAVNGAAVGSVYGLIGISYHLMFSVRGAVSFAQGDLTMLAGLLFLSLVGLSKSPWLALLAVLVAICAGSGLVERFCVRPAIKGGGQGLGWILATVGLAMFLGNTATILWGNIPMRFERLVALPDLQLGAIFVGGEELAAIVFGCAIVVALRLVLGHTIIGKSIRVTAADPTAAELSGIDSDRVSLGVFALSGAIAVFSMILIAPLTFVSPQFGFILGLKGFAAATVGGLERAEGPFVGGILLGIAEALAALLLWSGLKDAVAFLAIAFVILLCPGGLLCAGERPQEQRS